MSDRRLIEVAFPLKQASLDSVHEKNVRHGHISTLHIWPARRPLAACRAALIATLLPDPGDDEARRELLERIGGRVKETVKTRRLPNGEVQETIKEETQGGILHWKRESSPDLDWFRAQIRDAYGGRVPKVLDPFAGGGAIPLEAMRLGCEATAVDINPVAWFILKCTLEYPQKLAGKTWPLPEQASRIENGESANQESANRNSADQLGFADMDAGFAGSRTQGDLAEHVRYWGQWVLDRAREDLADYYPTIDGKPTVAYLWARTVTCKNCRGTLPLLKTTWLAKKGRKKRVVLELNRQGRQAYQENKYKNLGVLGDLAVNSSDDLNDLAVNFFSIRELPPKEKPGKDVGQGTMSRAGATCPHCGAIMTMEDLRTEGQAGRLGTVMTAVVVDGENGKEYRLPTATERKAAEDAADALDEVYADIPFGLPEEPTPAQGSGASRAFSVQNYGLMRWRDLFIPRQLLMLGTFVKYTRDVRALMRIQDYPTVWIEAISAYLAIALDRVADRASMVCTMVPSRETIGHTFARFALPITWDFAESAPINDASGGYPGAIGWINLCIEHAITAFQNCPQPYVRNKSSSVINTFAN